MTHFCCPQTLDMFYIRKRKWNKERSKVWPNIFCIKYLCSPTGWLYFLPSDLHFFSTLYKTHEIMLSHLDRAFTNLLTDYWYGHFLIVSYGRVCGWCVVQFLTNQNKLDKKIPDSTRVKLHYLRVS